MTNLTKIQALIQDGNVQSWIDSLLRSKQYTWQRGEAVTGLRAAAFLAAGGEVAVEVRAPIRDSLIIIDGHSIQVDFVRHQPA